MVQVTVEDVGPCKKLLKVQVDKATVKEKIDEGYEKLRASVIVDGFRKGRAPRRLLEKRYQEQVVEEVKQTVLSEASDEALKQEDLSPVGDPSFDNIKFEEGEDLSFDLTLEVKPEIAVGEYRGLKLVRKSAAVSDEELEEGLLRIARNRATLEVVTDGQVQEGDSIVCDWEVRSEGEVVANETDDEIAVAGRRFGDMEIGGPDVKDLAELLGAARAGDRRVGPARFLADYPIEKYREKEGEVAITVKEIKRAVVPELTDELAKELDFDSLNDLREHVRPRMEAEKTRWVQEELEEQVREELLKDANFDLPDGLVKAQARDYLTRQQLRMYYRGVPKEEIDGNLERIRIASEEAAERACRLFFIMEHLSEKEKLFVTENEVENRVAIMANARGMSVERMKQHLEENNQLVQLRAAMREEKAIDFILEHAETEDEAT